MCFRGRSCQRSKFDMGFHGIIVIVQCLLSDHVCFMVIFRCEFTDGKLQRHIRTTRSSCRAMRIVQIELNMFNKCQSGIISVFRAVATGTVVLCGFTAVAFFHFSPILSLFNVVCVVYGSLVYIVMYNSGFQLPRRVEKWKRQHGYKIKLLLNSASETPELQQLGRKVRSVCPRIMGVRVGGFYYLQRKSTPSFVDFNLRYIVRLMVVFGRH